ncbi:hypothetical protein [Streptomyces luteireticuli]|uniref:hypothetical protein n=1 Tax=Streptomyces luteireticuli TaxID=173858 RepID=UPI003555E5D3
MRFDAFHSDHPWVLDALEGLAAEWVASGRGRIGVKALFEQLRWDGLAEAGERPFRLDNSFTSHYARILRELHPEWADLIEVRRLRSVR